MRGLAVGVVTVLILEELAHGRSFVSIPVPGLPSDVLLRKVAPTADPWLGRDKGLSAR
jgi:hypothetical protein